MVCDVATSFLILVSLSSSCYFFSEFNHHGRSAYRNSRFTDVPLRMQALAAIGVWLQLCVSRFQVIGVLLRMQAFVIAGLSVFFLD